MGKLKHTKGKWKYDITNSTPNRLDIIIKSDSGDDIGWVYTIPEQGEANARLIAAAPEMLEGHTDIMKIIKGFEIGNLTAETAIGMIKIISETRIINATGLSIEEVLSE